MIVITAPSAWRARWGQGSFPENTDVEGNKLSPGVLLLHVNEGASKTHYIDISRWLTLRQPWVVRDVVDHSARTASTSPRSDLLKRPCRVA